MNAFDMSMRDQLRQAGLSEGEIKAWHGAAPRGTSDLSGDRGAYSAYWEGTQALLARLPKKPKRNGAEAAAAAALLEAGRRHRDIFLKAHAVAIYDLLEGIGKGVNPGPTFEEGFAVQAVLDAVERSVETHDWAKPETA